jgi:phosphopantetheinyl transferase
MPTPEVHLACARPGHWSAAQWHELEHLLDDGERDTACRYRFDADRGAYVTAHAMLKALVMCETGREAHELELCHDTKGRPFISQAPSLHVSLSRSRDAVACAVTRAAPVGVDLEQVDSKPVDAALLESFVVMSEPMTTRQFFFQWTSLEAFWKACGTGLADGNPRVRCVERNAARFDVHLENGTGGCAGRGAVVHAYDDCAMAVVLYAPAIPDFLLKRTSCRSASDIEQLARAHAAHERFFAA